jgi:hypothetical protein
MSILSGIIWTRIEPHMNIATVTLTLVPCRSDVSGGLNPSLDVTFISVGSRFCNMKRVELIFPVYMGSVVFVSLAAGLSYARAVPIEETVTPLFITPVPCGPR